MKQKDYSIRMFMTIVMVMMAWIGVRAEVLSGSCGATESDNVSWRLDTETGVLSIEGSGAMVDYKLNGNAPWLTNKDDIISATIANGVTHLSDYMLMRCSNLKSVSIPNSVTSMGKSLFLQCVNLESVSIPNSVTSIGDSPFNGCNKMDETIIVNDMLVLFSRSYKGDYVVPEGIKNIVGHAFAYCSGLTSITLPSGLTRIGAGAFRDCTSLKSVTIPESVTSVGGSVFFRCSGLESVTIPAGVSDLGGQCFDGCTSLNTIYNNATKPQSTAASTFTNCPLASATLYVPYGSKAKYEAADRWKDFGSIQEVYQGKCGHKGDDVSFTLNFSTGELLIEGTGKMASYSSMTDAPWNKYAADIKKITIKEGITAIGVYSLSGLNKATSVSFPESLTTIYRLAFYACSSLESVCLPNGINYMEDYVFGYCTGLKSANIPNTLTSVPNSMFMNCSGLETVDLPNSLTEIQSWAFCGCASLKSVDIPNSVNKIGHHAFSSCASLTSVVVPDGVESLEDAVFQSCTALSSVKIPNGVTSVGSSIFSNCPNLKDTLMSNTLMIYLPRDYEGAFVIPEGIKTIGSNAFESCKTLTSVTIPESVTLLDKYSFYGAINIVSIYNLSAEPQEVKDKVFYNVDLSAVTLHVPYGSKAKYEAAEGWKDFGTIIDDADYPRGACGAQGANVTFVLDLKTGELLIEGSGEMADYDSFTEVPWYAKAQDIVKVTIAEGVTGVGNNVFSCCSAIEEANLPESVERLGRYAFQYCGTLTSVTIPKNVTSIGEYCFDGCSGLTDVINLSPAPQTIEGSVFSGLDLSNITLHVLPGSKAAYQVAAVWKKFFSIVEDAVDLTGLTDAPAAELRDGCAVKVVENGRLVIRSRGKKFDAQGRGIR